MRLYDKLRPGVIVSVFPLMVVLSGPRYPSTRISSKPGPGCMAVLNVRLTVVFTGTLVSPLYGSTEVTFTCPVVQKLVEKGLISEVPDASTTASRGIINQCCLPYTQPPVA